MARKFNGSSDKILASLPSSSTRPITLAFWVYIISNIGGTAFGFGDQSHTGFGIEPVGLPGGGGSGTQWCAIDFGVVRQSSGNSLSTGQWYHLAVTIDGSSNISFYQNGSLVNTFGGFPAITATGSVVFGTDNSSVFTNNMLADCAVWNVVLAAKNIAALSNGWRPFNISPSNLIGWWPLDGISSPEPDLSGGARGGTLTGTSSSAGPPISMLTPRWRLGPAFFGNPAPPPPGVNLILTNCGTSHIVVTGAFNLGFSNGFPAEGINTAAGVLLLPVNCALAGQQKEPTKRAMRIDGGLGSMRGIFGE